MPNPTPNAPTPPTPPTPHTPQPPPLPNPPPNPFPDTRTNPPFRQAAAAAAQGTLGLRLEEVARAPGVPKLRREFQPCQPAKTPRLARLPCPGALSEGSWEGVGTLGAEGCLGMVIWANYKDVTRDCATSPIHRDPLLSVGELQ